MHKGLNLASQMFQILGSSMLGVSRKFRNDPIKHYHGGDAWCINTCSCIFQHGGRQKRWVNKARVATQRALIVIRYILGVDGEKAYPVV